MQYGVIEYLHLLHKSICINKKTFLHVFLEFLYVDGNKYRVIMYFFIWELQEFKKIKCKTL